VTSGSEPGRRRSVRQKPSSAASALLPLIGLLLSGCGSAYGPIEASGPTSTATNQSHPGGTRLEGLFYRSQREANDALTHFDREHPQCQLWTNWQKLCSRTGQDGATFCQVDQEHLARPSTPFCLAGPIDPAGPLYFTSRDTPETRSSRNRFCARFGDALVDPENPGNLPNCEAYTVDRPFNGTSLTSVAHPLCRHWVVRPPLQNGTRRLLYCDQWVPHNACPGIIGIIPPPTLSNGIIVFSDPIPTSAPVWGTFCPPREEPR
jgi:hypothetical protein